MQRLGFWNPVSKSLVNEEMDFGRQILKAALEAILNDIRLSRELKDVSVIRLKLLRYLIDEDFLDKLSEDYTKLKHFYLKKTGKYEFDVHFTLSPGGKHRISLLEMQEISDSEINEKDIGVYKTYDVENCADCKLVVYTAIVEPGTRRENLMRFVYSVAGGVGNLENEEYKRKHYSWLFKLLSFIVLIEEREKK